MRFFNSSTTGTRRVLLFVATLRRHAHRLLALPWHTVPRSGCSAPSGLRSSVPPGAASASRRICEAVRRPLWNSLKVRRSIVVQHRGPVRAGGQHDDDLACPSGNAQRAQCRVVLFWCSPPAASPASSVFGHAAVYKSNRANAGSCSCKTTSCPHRRHGLFRQVVARRPKGPPLAMKYRFCRARRKQPFQSAHVANYGGVKQINAERRQRATGVVSVFTVWPSKSSVPTDINTSACMVKFPFFTDDGSPVFSRQFFKSCSTSNFCSQPPPFNVGEAGTRGIRHFLPYSSPHTAQWKYHTYQCGAQASISDLSLPISGRKTAYSPRRPCSDGLHRLLPPAQALTVTSALHSRARVQCARRHPAS